MFLEKLRMTSAQLAVICYQGVDVLTVVIYVCTNHEFWGRFTLISSVYCTDDQTKRNIDPIVDSHAVIYLH